ncbi:uncharacterized protein LOC116613344 isoform X2 [Nematostella vectensis]|nr:uncharacterized protein LOC116613344 isoform X2 [Nematostella vectensis]
MVCCPVDMNKTLPPPASGASSDDAINLGYVISAAVVCAVAMMVALVTVVYRYLRHRGSGEIWFSKFYIREHYSSMCDDNQKQDNFIIGFANPMMENTEQTDGNNAGVQVLSYRPLSTEGGRATNDNSLVHKFLFPRDKLVFGSVLGSGWFGKVYVGEAHRFTPGVRKTKVIIKKLDAEADSRMRLRFIDEIETFRRVKHTNVLRVLGVATEAAPYLVIFHYTPFGDLKKFLLTHRSGRTSFIERGLALKISMDIASGLSCLHANSIYHSDLAARNCIVASDLSVKIGDFGISRSLYKEDYYKIPNSPESVPLRWLAPDSTQYNPDSGLTVNPPSEMGNVWSFGVTLWEVVEFGRLPYEDLTDDDVIQTVLVDQLYQLPEPKQTGRAQTLLYEVMRKCWADPNKRLTIRNVETVITSLMSQELGPRVHQIQDKSTLSYTSLAKQKGQGPSISDGNTTDVKFHAPNNWAHFDGLESTGKDIPQCNSIIDNNSLPTDIQVTEIHDCNTMAGDKHNFSTSDETLHCITTSDDTIPITDIGLSYDTANQPDMESTNDVTSAKVVPQPPVTYNGEGKGEEEIIEWDHSEFQPSVEGGKILEVKYDSDGSTPSVIIESQPTGYVVMPGEVIRRKSSLRRAGAKSEGKSVHYPMNILDLRVIYRYHKEEEEEEEDAGTDETVAMATSEDGPITGQGTDTDQHIIQTSLETQGSDITLPRFRSVKDSKLLLALPPLDGPSTSTESEQNPVSPTLKGPTSPVEKKIKRASRGAKFNDKEGEWLISIDRIAKKT